MWLFMDRMMGDWDPNQTCSVSTFLGCGCRRAGGGGGGGIRPTFLWGSLSIPRLARRDQGESIASLVSIQMDIPWTPPMDLHASWPDAVAPRLASLNVMGGKDPPLVDGVSPSISYHVMSKKMKCLNSSTLGRLLLFSDLVRQNSTLFKLSHVINSITIVVH